MKRKKHLLQSMQVILFLLLICYSGYGQEGDPCSLNAGGDFNICDSETMFSLEALAGTQINDVGIQWTTDSGQFEFSSENALATDVIIDGLPVGCHDFTVSAFCGDNNIPISATIQVCFGPAPTQANIIFNGQAVDVGTVCRELYLVGNSALNDDEVACWSILGGNDPNLGEINALENCFSNDDPSSTNNVLTALYDNVHLEECQVFTFRYTIENEFCSTVDEIDITFTGHEDEIVITNLSSQEIGDELCLSNHCITLAAPAIGCDMGIADVEWTISSPGILDGATTIQSTGVFQRFCFPEETNYTITYSVSEGPVCGEEAEVELNFNTCFVSDGILLPGLEYVYCDEIPSTVIFPDNTMIPWEIETNPFSIDASGIMINQNGVTAEITGIPPGLNSLELTQSSPLQGCPNCPNESRTIEILKGPDIELDDVSVDFLCGPVTNWRPWDEVESSNIVNAKVEVLSIPAGVTNLFVDQVFPGTTASLQLQNFGEYKFKLTTFRNGDNLDEPCEDEAIICVNVCDAGEPAAPTVSDLCVGAEVQLIGSNPLDDCANIEWIQVSGPTMIYTRGTTPNERTPWIRVDEIGTVCFQYSFSQDPDCLLFEERCFEVIPCCSEPSAIFECVDGGYCLVLESSDYVVCDGEICSDDYEAGDIVDFVVCVSDPLLNCTEIDSTSCCFDLSVEVPQCCIAPEVEFRCDSTTACLYINGITAVEYFGYLICGEEGNGVCVGFDQAGEILTYTICESIWMPDCSEADQACCWEYELEVPQCCTMPAPEIEASMVCYDGLICLEVNDQIAAQSEEFVFCGDELCLPFTAVGESVSYQVCERGTCGNDDLACCTQLDFIVPVCCDGEAPEVFLECPNEYGNYCLSINGQSVLDPLQYLICGDPKCFSADSDIESVSYTICEFGHGTNCEDDDPSCCWEYEFAVTECCTNPAPEIEADMVCHDGLICLEVNGQIAAQSEEFVFCGDQLCLPVSSAGESVSYQICERGTCGNGDLACCTLIDFVVPVCCEGEAPEVFLECPNEYGNYCLNINGQSVLEPLQYLICGAPKCFSADSGLESVSYTICEFGNGTDCGDDDPACCWEYSFDVTDCCPPVPELSFVCKTNKACMLINGERANTSEDFYITKPPCINLSQAGTERVIRVHSTIFPTCFWDIPVIIPSCNEECDIELSMICDETGTCLYINGVRADEQLDDYEIEHFSPCVDASLAGNSIFFRVVDRNNPDCAHGSYVLVPICGGNIDPNDFNISNPSDLSNQLPSIDDIIIYPNPASDKLNLDHELDEHVVYQILSLDGKVILEGKLSNEQTASISIEELTPGVHFIKFTNTLNQTVRTERFLKQ